MAAPSSNPPVKIAYPTEPVLNPIGQWTHLQRNGFRWSLLNNTTKQTKKLEDKEKIVVYETLLLPLMS